MVRQARHRRPDNAVRRVAHGRSGSAVIWQRDQRASQLREGFDSVTVHPVDAGAGAEDTYTPVEMPDWTQMREGLVIPAVGSKPPSEA